MGEMMKDAKRLEKVMEAVLKMKKLDIKALKQAYEQSEKAGAH